LQLALLLWLAACTTSAAALAGEPVATLQPYHAKYKTKARGFNLSITRKLETSENNGYVLTSGGKILVGGFHEVSVFSVRDQQVLPRSYIYQGTGLVNRRREVHFSTDPGAINSLYKDKWYDLPYTPETLDRMSQLEQLRLSLLSEPEPVNSLTMRVADGKRVKDSELVLIAEEVLETPLGSIDTLHFERLHDDNERKSDIWLAPQWDYLMVKTVHIEDGDPVEMVLVSATLGGQPVTADTTPAQGE
jgi:hypothetical protein